MGDGLCMCLTAWSATCPKPGAISAQRYCVTSDPCFVASVGEVYLEVSLSSIGDSTMVLLCDAGPPFLFSLFS